MQAFKVTTDTGVYFARALYGYKLSERRGVVAVEAQEETPLVRASVVFDGGTTGPIDPGFRDRVIARMVDGECLWHASAQEAGTRCFCASCSTLTGALAA